MNTSPKQYYQFRHSTSISCHHLGNAVQQSWNQEQDLPRPLVTFPCPRRLFQHPVTSLSFFGRPGQKQECWFLYKDYSFLPNGLPCTGSEKLEPTQLLTPPIPLSTPQCFCLVSPSFFSIPLISFIHVPASLPKLFNFCPQQFDFYTNTGQLPSCIVSCDLEYIMLLLRSPLFTIYLKEPALAASWRGEVTGSKVALTMSSRWESHVYALPSLGELESIKC